MLGYDLGVAITGSERIGLTVVITEGFGEIAMSDALSASCNNAKADSQREQPPRFEPG